MIYYNLRVRVPAILLSHRHLRKYDSTCFIYANVFVNFKGNKKLALLRIEGRIFPVAEINKRASKFAYYLVKKYNHEIMVLAEKTVSCHLTAKILSGESEKITRHNKEVSLYTIRDKDLAYAEYLLADLEYKAKVDLTNRRVTWFVAVASFLSGIATSAAAIYYWKDFGF